MTKSATSAEATGSVVAAADQTVPGAGNANAVAIQHIKLENEGWERDTSVTEPAEPTLQNVAT